MILLNPILTPESETSDLEASVADLQSEIFEICNLKYEMPAPPPADASMSPRLRGEKPVSPRRLAANRANALKSTGPRTPQGKARSRLNALKHGVCSDSPVLPSECAATFATFRHELECDLRPRNPIQLTLFQRIVNLSWKLRRVQEAENHLFDIEAAKVPPNDDGAPPDPCRILAHRFSDDPHNGFILLNRYEQGMHRELRQLITRFFHVQKQVPTTPYSDEDLQPAHHARRDDFPNSNPAAAPPDGNPPPSDPLKSEIPKSEICDLKSDLPPTSPCLRGERERNEPTDRSAPNPQPPAAPELADSTPPPAHSPLRNEAISIPSAAATSNQKNTSGEVENPGLPRLSPADVTGNWQPATGNSPCDPCGLAAASIAAHTPRPYPASPGAARK